VEGRRRRLLPGLAAHRDVLPRAGLLGTYVRRFRSRRFRARRTHADGGSSLAGREQTVQQRDDATAVRQAGGGRATDATSVLTWNNDLVCVDPSTGYEIRVATEAVAEMRTETRHGEGPDLESASNMCSTLSVGVWRGQGCVMGDRENTLRRMWSLSMWMREAIDHLQDLLSRRRGGRP
jgi:hypothetical protein